jgi:hypothetical protein
VVIRRSSTLALLVGAAAAAAVAGVVWASAAALTVTPKNSSAFRACVLTAYPNASTVSIDSWADESGKKDDKTSGDVLQITSSKNKNQRAFLRFDLTKCSPPLAAPATVKQATLRLYTVTLPASARTYNAQRVTGPCNETATTCWTESGLNWNSQPPVAAAVTSTLTMTSSPGGYYGWDVTADVASMVAGTTSNSGWRIADSVEDAATQVGVVFRSRRAQVSSQTPQLVITYSP